MPYGFPSGATLVDEIIESLTNVDAEVERLFEPDFDRPHRWAFAQALMGSQRTSIDTFLEGNKGFTEIGKLAISYCLFGYERREAVLRCTHLQQWYKYFFNTFLLKSSPENFAENKLLVITFNYDRSFEFALVNAIKDSYGMSEQDAQQTMASGLRMLHLHGDLGALFESDGGPGEQRDFTPALTPESVGIAQRRIRVVHDDSPVTLASYNAANEALQKYEIACFLGFSYNEVSLQRLRPGLVEARHGDKPTILWGTTFGLVRNDFLRIERGLGRGLSWTSRDHCLEFLQQAQWFDPVYG
jgi:hypothetical protein